MRKTESRIIIGLTLCGGILAAAAGIGALAELGAEEKPKAAPMAAFSAPQDLNVGKAMHREPEADYKPRNAPLIDRAPPISDARQDLNQNFGAGNAGLETQPRGILNGYKGYRYRRPGYKSAGDGWWYPDGAFPKREAIEKFVQKPVMAAARKPEIKRRPEKAKPEVRKAKPKARSAAKSSAALIAEHQQWCAAHHASYNPGTNNYREILGQKRQCASPYFH